MGDIFALWNQALWSRWTVLFQIYGTVVAGAVAGMVGALFALLFHSAVIAFVVGGAAGFYMVILTLGAAYGAVAEAVRGEPASGYFTRGQRLWGRTLVFLAVEVVMVCVLVLMLGLVIGSSAVTSALAQGHLTTQNLIDMLGPTRLIVVVAIGFLVAPYTYAFQASIYCSRRGVGESLGRAFSDVFSGGRWHKWLGSTLIAMVLVLAGDGFVGLGGIWAILGVLLDIVSPWLIATLMFATWQMLVGEGA